MSCLVGLTDLHTYCYWIHGDRKSTRLNSSHLGISDAVFCLKKKEGAGLSPPASPLRLNQAHLSGTLAVSIVDLDGVDERWPHHVLRECGRIRDLSAVRSQPA